jgi:hypothetical protein
MKTAKPRSAADLSTLDACLDEQGVREAFQAVAIKEVLAWRLGEAMKAQKLSRKRMAERMGTIRSQIKRLLNPNDGNLQAPRGDCHAWGLSVASCERPAPWRETHFRL